jgi:hypothetical protein
MGLALTALIFSGSDVSRSGQYVVDQGHEVVFPLPDGRQPQDGDGQPVEGLVAALPGTASTNATSASAAVLAAATSPPSRAVTTASASVRAASSRGV